MDRMGGEELSDGVHMPRNMLRSILLSAVLTPLIGHDLIDKLAHDIPYNQIFVRFVDSADNGAVPRPLFSQRAREVRMHFPAGCEDLCGRMFAPVAYYVRKEGGVLAPYPGVVPPLAKACLNQRLYTAKLYLLRC
jgi:hypothetical protein